MSRTLGRYYYFKSKDNFYIQSTIQKTVKISLFQKKTHRWKYIETLTKIKWKQLILKLSWLNKTLAQSLQTNFNIIYTHLLGGHRTNKMKKNTDLS